MRAWSENGVVRRWFYSTDKGEVPILPDEIIHFKEWNSWNEIRGVTPLISLSQEIVVLGKGTSFEPLTMTPAALKFFDLERWNLYTILAKYGIPMRVAHVQDVRSGLSGKDTAEQHAAFWKYTIIPALRNFEQIIETQFFSRFGLREKGVFDTSDIPELQESEAERSKRDISEIEAGIKTINDVLTECGLVEKSTGIHGGYQFSKRH